MNYPLFIKMATSCVSSSTNYQNYVRCHIYHVTNLAVSCISNQFLPQKFRTNPTWRVICGGWATLPCSDTSRSTGYPAYIEATNCNGGHTPKLMLPVSTLPANAEMTPAREHEMERTRFTRTDTHRHTLFAHHAWYCVHLALVTGRKTIADDLKAVCCVVVLWNQLGQNVTQHVDDAHAIGRLWCRKSMEGARKCCLPAETACSLVVVVVTVQTAFLLRRLVRIWLISRCNVGVCWPFLGVASPREWKYKSPMGSRGLNCKYGQMLQLLYIQYNL